MPESTLTDEMRRWRGVSPIIASLLMFIVVASLGVGLFAYSNNFFQSYEATFSGTLEGRQEKIKERIVIEYVVFRDTPKEIVVYLRNTGQIDSTISSIFVLNNSTGEVLYSDTDLDLSLSVESFTQRVVPYAGWESGKSYQVKVVTGRGSSVNELWGAR